MKLLPPSLRRQRGLIGPAPTFIGKSAGFTVGAIDLDTTNQFTRASNLTGIADSKSGVFSCWFCLEAITTRNIFRYNNFGFGVNLSGSNNINIAGRNNGSSAGNLTNLQLFSTHTFTADSVLHHMLASWDVSTPGAGHFYLDDIDDLDLGNFSDSTLDLDLGTSMGIGGPASGSSGRFNGGLAEIFFTPGQYIDLSVEENRRKFITADGLPADLGPNGSLPLGVQPLVYLHIDDGEAPANFGINHGSGGNFTEFGTVGTYPTPPAL